MGFPGPIGPGRRTVKSRGDTTFVQVGGHGADVDTTGLDPSMIGTLEGRDTVSTAPQDHPAIPHPFNLGRVIGNSFRRALTGQLGARTQEAMQEKQLAPIQAKITERKLQNRGARFGRKTGI